MQIVVRVVGLLCRLTIVRLVKSSHSSLSQSLVSSQTPWITSAPLAAEALSGHYPGKQLDRPVLLCHAFGYAINRLKGETVVSHPALTDIANERTLVSRSSTLSCPVDRTLPSHGAIQPPKLLPLINFVCVILLLPRQVWLSTYGPASFNTVLPVRRTLPLEGS
jgi:hypothetical protein